MKEEEKVGKVTGVKAKAGWVAGVAQEEVAEAGMVVVTVEGRVAKEMVEEVNNCCHKHYRMSPHKREHLEKRHPHYYICCIDTRCYY
jgi:hypothetical protein